jgi:hypothetical protein
LNQANTNEPKKFTTASQFVRLTSLNVCIVFVFFAACFMVFRSFPLGMAMLCTGLGFLLINSPFGEKTKNIIGLALAFVGYMVCLPGTFNPVDQVVIKPYAVGFGGQPVAVTVDASSCHYEMRSSKLTCDAQVLQAASSPSQPSSTAK